MKKPRDKDKVYLAKEAKESSADWQKAVKALEDRITTLTQAFESTQKIKHGGSHSRKNFQNKPRNMDEVVCYCCGQRGHYLRSCPARETANGLSMNPSGANNSQRNGSWLSVSDHSGN